MSCLLGLGDMYRKDTVPARTHRQLEVPQTRLMSREEEDCLYNYARQGQSYESMISGPLELLSENLQTLHAQLELTLKY